MLTSKQTDLEDCAQTFVDIARNSSMTGQKIVVGEFFFSFSLLCRGDVRWGTKLIMVVDSGLSQI